MAQQTPRHLLSFFGFVLWGDIAEMTVYRSKRHKIVFFAKTYPDKPPSPKQQTVRQNFAAAIAAWRALSPGQRHQWHLAAARSCLCATGYNLFIHWQLTGDDKAIETLERQTGLALLPP